ncbi:SLC26A/SulP transporter family protein [Humidesulfovibrio idahonensis]
MLNNNLKELLHDAATPQRFIPALSSGFVVGLLIVVVELSLASLIFSGPLAGFAPRAAGLMLFGGFAMCLVVALGSGFPSSVCLPEDAPAAIMASVAGGIAAGLAGSASPHETAVTVGAALALSTLASGVIFLILGRFGLGNLMRYMPYPVVGGFMAGIGWLLVQGSVPIITGVALNLHDLPLLLTAEKLLRLLPGVALTVTLLWALRRWSSVFILPGVLALSLGAFALYLGVTGQSLAEAGQAGHLLGGMPEGSMLWPVFSLADLSLIRWDALVEQIPQLCTIPLVSAISFLLIASGLETAARRDLDLKHELYLNAVANFIAGPGGSHAGYTALSFSMLGPKTGSDSRLVGVSAALLTGVATFFGAAVLGYVPRFVLGGMVLFLGVATMLDWVVAVRRQVSRLEYALIWAILFAIGLFGFLTGVGFGLVMAAVVFVIKYSRLPVLRQDADMSALPSTKKRSVPDRHILREHGASVRVLRVTGYLFFGSANLLSRSVAAHLAPDADQPHADQPHADRPQAGPGPSHLILDFADVDGFDSSAINCFLRMLQRCSAAGCQVVFASSPPTLQEQLHRSSPLETAGARFLPDLDRALEWCEDAVLAREQARLESQRDAAGRDKLFDLAVDDMLQRLEEEERFEALVERLGPYLDTRQAAAGEVMVRQGERPDGVWLLLSGQAEEVARSGAGTSVRLRTLGPGGIAGHAAAGQANPAPGDIVTLTDCALAFLPASALRRLELEDQATALAFYSLFAASLESRLAGDASPS